MRIVMGSDHGGYHLKEIVRRDLEERGYEVLDCGTHSTDSCDYPDIALAVTAHVNEDADTLGILICGTGIGIGIAANKIPGIRAALCHDTFSAKAARAHNNANVLTMGERVIGPGLAMDIVHAFLNSSFEGGRHERRVNKLTAIEEGAR